MDAFTAGAVNWTAIGSVCALFGVVVVIAGGVATRVNRWRSQHAAEIGGDERVNIALFGRPAKAPYPAIPGLIEEHDQVISTISTFGGRLDSLEAELGGLRGAVAKLVERTEENGGNSIKDQMNRMDDWIREQRRKGG